MPRSSSILCPIALRAGREPILSQPIFKREHLALLSNAYMSINRARGLPKNSFINGTATAPNRSSTTMEDCNFNAIARPKGSQPALRLVQLPTGGQDTPIFTTIGVAQHHLLPVMARL